VNTDGLNVCIHFKIRASVFLPLKVPVNRRTGEQRIREHLLQGSLPLV